MTVVVAGGAALLGALAMATWARARFNAVGHKLRALAKQVRRMEHGGMPEPTEGEKVLPALQEVEDALQRLAHVQRETYGSLRQQLVQRTADLALQTAALAQARARIGELTILDPLTGLPNRRRVQELLHAEILRHRRTGGTLSLVLCSIDRFQAIHDALGAARSGEVVQTVAERLAKACRCTDFVGRLDGDEFVVLLPETGADGAAVVAKKLLQAVASTPCREAGKVTLSMDVLVRVETVDASDALATARASMHRARRMAKLDGPAHGD